MRSIVRTALGVAVLLGLGALAACGEREQTAQPSARKSDGKPWDVAQNGYVAPGWKVGDQASWDQQLRSRAAHQNEYNRTAARAPQ